jgi:hypothetical protein
MQSANWGWAAFDRDRNKPIISAAAAGIFDACPIIDITFDRATVPPALSENLRTPLESSA